MIRAGTAVVALLVLFSGLTAGYMAGARGDDPAPASEQEQADERVVAAFYDVLGSLTQLGAEERLAKSLSPDFIEQRLDIQQTLEREAFVRAVIQEARTFPERRLVPTRVGSDRGWVVVMVQTVDAAPGRFGSIPMPESTVFQKELLHVQDGKVTGRVVLEGTGSLLRSLAPMHIAIGGFGSHTIKVAQRDYAAHAAERLVFTNDTVIVVDRGRFALGSSTTSSILNEGDAIRLRAGREHTIRNEGGTAARLLLVVIAPVETPMPLADANRMYESAPGVTVSVVAQSGHFISETRCLVVSPGLVTMAAGLRLPSHLTPGYEMVIPTTGEIEARSERSDFLRTDSERHWQDETTFATLSPGVAVAAPPAAWTSYAVSGQATARFWVFVVEIASSC